MKKFIAITVIACIAALFSLLYFSHKNSLQKADSMNGVTQKRPDELNYYAREGQLIREKQASKIMNPGSIKISSLSSREIISRDPRLIALSKEELAWMEEHYYPTQEELDNLDKIDTSKWKGSKDPKLNTLRGLALIKQDNIPAALAVLTDAASVGAVYAYEEAAMANYQLSTQRLGKSQDSDNILRAQLEVAKILGDYKADYLISKYLPNYDTQANAAAVQRHTTEFLRQLGNNAQLRSVPAAGPDPRPNLDQWNDINELNQSSGTPIQLDTYTRN